MRTACRVPGNIRRGAAESCENVVGIRKSLRPQLPAEEYEDKCSECCCLTRRAVRHWATRASLVADWFSEEDADYDTVTDPASS